MRTCVCLWCVRVCVCVCVCVCVFGSCVRIKARLFADTHNEYIEAFLCCFTRVIFSFTYSLYSLETSHLPLLQFYKNIVYTVEKFIAKVIVWRFRQLVLSARPTHSLSPYLTLSLYVCMYVYKYVYMAVYIHIYIYICVYAPVIFKYGILILIHLQECIEI